MVQHASVRRAAIRARSSAGAEGVQLEKSTMGILGAMMEENEVGFERCYFTTYDNLMLKRHMLQLTITTVSLMNQSGLDVMLRSKTAHPT